MYSSFFCAWNYFLYDWLIECPVCQTSSLTAKLDLQVPDLPVMAMHGEDVILNCFFNNTSPFNISDVSVFWMTTDTKRSIHSYWLEKDQLKEQAESYANRTKMFPSQLTTGNASLLLRRVVVADEGSYTCFVRVKDYGSAALLLQVAGELSCKICDSWKKLRSFLCSVRSNVIAKHKLENNPWTLHSVSKKEHNVSSQSSLLRFDSWPWDLPQLFPSLRNSCWLLWIKAASATQDPYLTAAILTVAWRMFAAFIPDSYNSQQFLGNVEVSFLNNFCVWKGGSVLHGKLLMC